MPGKKGKTLRRQTLLEEQFFVLEGVDRRISTKALLGLMEAMLYAVGRGSEVERSRELDDKWVLDEL